MNFLLFHKLQSLKPILKGENGNGKDPSFSLWFKEVCVYVHECVCVCVYVVPTFLSDWLYPCALFRSCMIIGLLYQN